MAPQPHLSAALTPQKVSYLAPSESASFFQSMGTCSSMDGAIHAASAQKALIGCVDDCVDRRKFGAREKIRIVLEGLRGESAITDLWQTDFTYLKVVHWGWYYLSTVMEDFWRYIIAWQLCRTMRAEDVKNTLDLAIERTGVENVNVFQRLRLLSDNGACFISHRLKAYLESHEIRHVRTKVYHPLTQGKIERCHRSMKNLILLDNDYAAAELTERIREWVDYYNHRRYHEAIDNVTPADKYYGRNRVILKKWKKSARRP